MFKSFTLIVIAAVSFLMLGNKGCGEALQEAEEAAKTQEAAEFEAAEAEPEVEPHPDKGLPVLEGGPEVTSPHIEDENLDGEPDAGQ